MRKICASLLSLILFLAACTSSRQTPPATVTPIPPPENDPFNTDWDDRSIFKTGLVESQQSVLSELEGASVYHIEFTIADDLFHVAGHEEIRYTNTEALPLDEIQFRLFPNIIGGKMEVDNISINDQPVEPKYDLESSLMILPFDAPLEPGQSVILRMNFKVTVPQEVELNYGVLAFFDNVLALGHAYPMIAVYDDEGWNAEIPPQSGDLTYGDAAFFLVKIIAPRELTVVTTGTKISQNEEAQSQRLVVASGPARDFYLAASSTYEEVSQTFGEVTIHSYARSGDDEGARTALEVASRSIDIFNERYAPYPYTELDIVSTPTLALGIEYPGMIALTSRIYDLNAEYNGNPTRVYMESTVAHEVAHQWFYNLVGDDQLDDPWLDESFAQFATLQYYSDEYGTEGAQGFQDSLEGRWNGATDVNIPIGLPVAAYSGRDYGAIVYGRGPLFLVALKEQMGKDIFDQFMKDYTAQLSWHIATPEFMQSFAEEHCSCDLDPIFNEWVYP